MPTREERIPKKKLPTKMESDQQRSRTRWIDKIRRDIELRGENWEEIQENRKWENRSGWRLLCNSPASLETTYELW